MGMSEQELSEVWRRASDLWRERGWDQARDDVETLLDEVKRLRAENAALREIAQAVAGNDDETDVGLCPFCSQNIDADEDLSHAPDCPDTRARVLLAK